MTPFPISLSQFHYLPASSSSSGYFFSSNHLLDSRTDTDSSCGSTTFVVVVWRWSLPWRLLCWCKAGGALGGGCLGEGGGWYRGQGSLGGHQCLTWNAMSDLPHLVLEQQQHQQQPFCVPGIPPVWIVMCWACVSCYVSPGSCLSPCCCCWPRHA